MGLEKKKLKELKTSFMIILKDYGLTKFEILRIAKLLLIEVEIRTEKGANMQKAIENYIDIQNKLGKLFDEIKVEIDKVEEAAIEKARKKQLRQWRKMESLKK